jgi:cation:H+ antiporter
MALFWASILLAVGLLILVKGADWLVDGAVAIARHLGLNTLIIGLTIVAMGTSAPEVAASVTAALSGSGDIAVGNVYGSNIANLALVGGICALIRPILVSGSVLIRDLPIMLAATLLLRLLLADGFFSRPESLLMLILFTGVIVLMIKSEKRKELRDSDVLKEAKEAISHAAALKPAKAALFIVLGLIGLGAGARLAVTNAVFLGQAAGISDAVIGLTIIAIGTSLPELITCLIASFKGHDDLSVGNLVGSNIFNAMFVLGITGSVRPFAVSPRLIGLDFWLVVLISVVFAGFAYLSPKIGRFAGLVLSGIYVGYMVYLFAVTG